MVNKRCSVLNVSNNRRVFLRLSIVCSVAGLFAGGLLRSVTVVDGSVRLITGTLAPQLLALVDRLPLPQ